jgi:putative ABC transport system ATP-binding protein
MIRFERVSVTQQGHLILREVSFTVNTGEKAVIVGPSGAGKTTVLLAAVGARPIGDGAVYFDGERLGPSTVERIRQECSFIMQEPVLGAEQSREALLLPYRFRANRGKTPSREEIAAVLHRLDLEESVLEKPAAVLSGGEKQRMVIARALLMKKRTFLLDECTSALDERSAERIFAVFSDPAFTVLSVSHDPRWSRICARRIVMHAGAVTATEELPGE